MPDRAVMAEYVVAGIVGDAGDGWLCSIAGPNGPGRLLGKE